MPLPQRGPLLGSSRSALPRAPSPFGETTPCDATRAARTRMPRSSRTAPVFGTFRLRFDRIQRGADLLKSFILAGTVS